MVSPGALDNLALTVAIDIGYRELLNFRTANLHAKL